MKYFTRKFHSLLDMLWIMELKGKPLSLGAKILGAFIAVGALVLKATISPELDIDAAIKVAAFVVVIFAPVDLSMVMSNIFAKGRETTVYGGGL